MKKLILLCLMFSLGVNINAQIDYKQQKKRIIKRNHQRQIEKSLLELLDFGNDNLSDGAWDNLDDTPADQTSTDIKFDEGNVFIGNNLGNGRLTVYSSNYQKPVNTHLFNTTDDGSVSLYQYGMDITNRLRNGDRSFFNGIVNRLTVDGTGNVNIDQVMRGTSTSVTVNNPNANVSFVQTGHPNVTLTQGIIGEVNHRFFDIDVAEGNIGSTLFFNGDFNVLQIDGGSFQTLQSHLASNGYVARAIYSPNNWRSDFGGLVHYNGNVINYNTASNKALVNIELLDTKIKKNTTDILGTTTTVNTGNFEVVENGSITGVVLPDATTTDKYILYIDNGVLTYRKYN